MTFRHRRGSGDWDWGSPLCRLGSVLSSRVVQSVFRGGTPRRTAEGGEWRRRIGVSYKGLAPTIDAAAATATQTRRKDGQARRAAMTRTSFPPCPPHQASPRATGTARSRLECALPSLPALWRGIWEGHPRAERTRKRAQERSDEHASMRLSTVGVWAALSLALLSVCTPFSASLQSTLNEGGLEGGVGDGGGRPHSSNPTIVFPWR